MTVAPRFPDVAQIDRPQIDNSTGVKGMSSRKFPEKRQYRRSFPEKWQQFIASEFESPAHAAFEFGCDPDTAEGWFEGRHAPSGAFVGWAYARWPERVAAYLSGVFS